MTEKIQFEFGLHREKAVIFISFDYDAALIARIKKLTGVHSGVSPQKHGM